MAACKAAGHSVTVLDLGSGVANGLRTVACDCTDFGQVMGALSGADMLHASDAIVHLAGIPQRGVPIRVGLDGKPRYCHPAVPKR